MITIRINEYTLLLALLGGQESFIWDASSIMQDIEDNGIEDFLHSPEFKDACFGTLIQNGCEYDSFKDAILYFEGIKKDYPFFNSSIFNDVNCGDLFMTHTIEYND